MDRFAAMGTFVRVIETGSFSAAAYQLRIGQPAVSKTVAQLEERLGVRLLARSTRGVTPTEAGQNFYERAKRAIDEADEAEVAARGASASLCGELRISADVALARRHVVPRLAEPAQSGRHARLLRKAWRAQSPRGPDCTPSHRVRRAPRRNGVGFQEREHRNVRDGERPCAHHGCGWRT